MSKSLRLLQLLELMLSQPGIAMPDMVRELDLSERTIYRYLSALGSDLCVPLYCDRGGYYLNGKTFLGPLSLTPHEMMATALSLTTSPAAVTYPFAEHTKSALRKIKLAVNSNTMEQIQPILDRSMVQPLPYEGNEQPELMERLLRATVAGNRLKLLYYSARSEKEKQIVFDPYAITFRRHAWYIVGYSAEHKEIIQLKIIRIRELAETDENFEPPVDFSAEEFYRKSWEVWAGESEVEVRVRFSAKVAPIIKETRRHPQQQVEELPDGGIIYSVRVAGIREISFWILGWGVEAEVLGPPELIEQMSKCAQQLANFYNKNISKSSSN